MLGQAADRVLPGLRTDIVKYLESQGLAKRTDPHDIRLLSGSGRRLPVPQARGLCTGGSATLARTCGWR